MDERAINGAAIEAIRDLELDCEIKEVNQRAGRDEWCIQFSGKYGQFCDEFKNQFGEESSPQVVREKIKSHLIKQVNKIRSSTGRRRKMASGEPGESQRPEEGSSIFAAPLKLIGEVFNRVTGVAGEAVSQASAVAEAVGQTVAAADISPVTIEVRSTARVEEERATPSPRKAGAKAPAKKRPAAKSAAKRAAKGAAKQAKKAGKAAKRSQKTSGKAPARAKAAKKSSRRVK